MYDCQILEVTCRLDTKHCGILSKSPDFWSNQPSTGHQGPLANILWNGQTSYEMFIGHTYEFLGFICGLDIKHREKLAKTPWSN